MNLIKCYIITHLKNIHYYLLIPIISTVGILLSTSLYLIIPISSVIIDTLFNIIGILVFGMIPLIRINQKVVKVYHGYMNRKKSYLVCNLISVCTIGIFIIVCVMFDLPTVLFDYSFFSLLLYLLIQCIKVLLK